MTPNLSLIAAANASGLIPTCTTDHPVVAAQAYRAGLPRSPWQSVSGPGSGLGVEHWYRDGNGALAYSQETGDRSRLIIFDASGVPIADVRHVMRKAA